MWNRLKRWRSLLSQVVGATLAGVIVFVVYFFPSLRWAAPVAAPLYLPVAVVAVLLPGGVQQSIADLAGGAPAYLPELREPGPSLLSHLVVSVPTYVALWYAVLGVRKWAHGRRLGLRLLIWSTPFIVLASFVPVWAALRVITQGWCGERTWYREAGFILDDLPGRPFLSGAFWWTARPFGRWETRYLARRDFAAGRVRFLGVGRGGLALAGLNSAEASAHERFPWSCLVAAWRTSSGQVQVNEFSLAHWAPANPGRQFLTLGPEQTDVLCFNGSGVERQFAVELSRLDDLVTPDQAEYNRTMLAELLGRGAPSNSPLQRPGAPAATRPTK